MSPSHLWNLQEGVKLSDSVAASKSDETEFSVESLINEANQAWDEPDDTPSGVDVATNESPATPGAEPTAEPPTQEVLDRGDGRDPKGRFAPKGEKPVEQVPEAKAPDAAIPTQAAAEATPETPPGQAEVEQGSPESYSVRFGGQDYQIPGAVRTESHVVIPREQEETVNRYIGMGLKYETEREAIKREKAQTAVEREIFTAETGPVMEEVKNLFDICSLPDEQQFAEAITAYVWKLRESIPILKERMELSKKRQELTIKERMSAPDPEEVAQHLHQTSVTTAEAHLASWKQDPQTKPLTETDWQWVQGRVKADPAYFLQRAGRQVTSEEAQAGVSPGEVYFNQAKLSDLVNIRLEHRRDLARAVEAQKQAVSLAKENAVRQAAGSVPPPPASGGADAAPAKAEESGNKKYGSLDELKKDLGVSW